MQVDFPVEVKLTTHNTRTKIQDNKVLYHLSKKKLVATCTYDPFTNHLVFEPCTERGEDLNSPVTFYLFVSFDIDV